MDLSAIWSLSDEWRVANEEQSWVPLQPIVFCYGKYFSSSFACVDSFKSDIVRATSRWLDTPAVPHNSDCQFLSCYEVLPVPQVWPVLQKYQYFKLIPPPIIETASEKHCFIMYNARDKAENPHVKHVCSGYLLQILVVWNNNPLIVLPDLTGPEFEQGTVGTAHVCSGVSGWFEWLRWELSRGVFTHMSHTWAQMTQARAWPSRSTRAFPHGLAISQSGSWALGGDSWRESKQSRRWRQMQPDFCPGCGSGAASTIGPKESQFTRFKGWGIDLTSWWESVRGFPAMF